MVTLMHACVVYCNMPYQVLHMHAITNSKASGQEACEVYDEVLREGA